MINGALLCLELKRLKNLKRHDEWRSSASRLFWGKKSKEPGAISHPYMAGRKTFDFEIFGSKYVLKHSESFPTKKFGQIFLKLSFFHYFGHFGRKRQIPRKKFTTRKFFRFRDFHSTIRFETFWIEYDQKNFTPKIFDCVIFHYFGQKMTESQEKIFYTGKIFDFEIFGIRYVLRHSELISTKNFLTPPFLHHCWLKKSRVWPFSNSLGQNEKRPLQTFCAILLRSF